MANVEVLYTPAHKPDLPQCDAMRQSAYANDAPETDRRCKWSARYRLNGQNLCSKHAGPVALDILVKQQKEPADDPAS